jgi:hypothetical protein
MFEFIDITLDFKDLEILRTALENQISYLSNQVFLTEEDKEAINDYKQLLKKIKDSQNDLLKDFF